MKIAYNLTLDNIIDASGGKFIISGDGTNPLVFNEIFMDSREEFSKNSIFIALKGRHFNGEAFVGDVLKNGAACAIVSWDFLDNSDLSPFGDKIIIAVRDATEALGNIAKMYLNLFNPEKRVAITGSCGKTTTKEMVYKILTDKFGKDKVLKNDYNFNNLIGVPKTILGLNERHKFIVLEIGTNQKGEIKKLAEIISPNIGVIINIGKSHLLEFKDIKGVFEEKISLTESLKKNSYLIINGDDKMLAKVYGSMPDVNFLSFGIFGKGLADAESKKPDLFCEKIDIKGNITEIVIDFMNKKHYAAVKVEGAHLLYDMLCAILTAYACGIDIEFSIKSMEDFNLPKGRMEIIEDSSKEYILINDSYNSNPDSLKAALDSIKAYYRDKKKILVLGDMLELGESSETEHYKAGLEAAGFADYIFYKGYFYNNFKEGLKQGGFDETKLFFFDEVSLFREKFNSIDKRNGVILVKGSRGMALERYFDELREESSNAVCN